MMTSELEVGLYIFMLRGFLGYPLIPRVPPLLHTPLMSATNAIAAISLVGSLVVAGADYSHVPYGWICTALGFMAVTCSATNAVGGFLITDRMLRMFRKSGEQRATAKTFEYAGITAVSVVVAALVGAAIYIKKHQVTTAQHGASDELLKLSYIVSAAMFILGLKGLSSP